MEMSPILGNLIVVLVLGAAVLLAIRSLWKTHKEGGHCSGDCGRCGGCCGKHTP